MTRPPLGASPVFPALKPIFCALAFSLALAGSVSLGHAQAPNSPVPYINAGPDPFAQTDFNMMYLDQMDREARAKEHGVSTADREKIYKGVISALDLEAPSIAVREFNRATTLMKAQNSNEAIKHLKKAIGVYPKFVSAHNALGLVYMDQEHDRARGEFETAAKLDDKFPGSFLNLGMLALSENDYASADSNLEKASTLNPNNAKILAALVFAQNGDRAYERAVKSAQRVHALDHPGMANVHYIAAAAAVRLNDFSTVQRELNFFLSEDPANPLAPIARKNLELLSRRSAQPVPPPSVSRSGAGSQPEKVQTFPNSEHLQAELNNAGNEVAEGNESGLPEPDETVADTASATATPAPMVTPVLTGGLYTIRKAVDETALFFAVSNYGHMVSDLDLSDIRISDDGKPPVRITQFSPQSKLPLRLGLLIDTSGSVHERFAFEKLAAVRFLEKVLNSQLDLAFVAGFSNNNNVTQDFSADPDKLAQGIEKLMNGGGTALFDSVTFACWKLAAYPESERVANVLVVLTDGEDNSSHRSLKQAIAEAEKAGVTIYTVSTTENVRAETDADKILQVLAERSGGEAIFPGDMHEFDKSLNRLRDLIRSRYLVVYKPADFTPHGKFRAVRVIAEKDGEHLHVHVRKGYNARTEAHPN